MRLAAFRMLAIGRSSLLSGSYCQVRSLHSVKSLCSSKKILDDSDPNTRRVKKEITDLPGKELYPEYNQTEKGVVYDKKPFKYSCIEGKAYVWCSCGRSHKQVIIDVPFNYIQITNVLSIYSHSAMERTRMYIWKLTFDRFAGTAPSPRIIGSAIASKRSIHLSVMAPTSSRASKLATQPFAMSTRLQSLRIKSKRSKYHRVWHTAQSMCDSRSTNPSIMSPYKL